MGEDTSVLSSMTTYLRRMQLTILWVQNIASTAGDQNGPDSMGRWPLLQIIIDLEPEHIWGTIQLFSLSMLSL